MFFKGEMYIKSQGYSNDSNMIHIVTSKKMRDCSVPSCIIVIKQKIFVYFMLSESLSGARYGYLLKYVIPSISRSRFQIYFRNL